MFEKYFNIFISLNYIIQQYDLSGKKKDAYVELYTIFSNIIDLKQQTSSYFNGCVFKIC
jgi:hypothetical protein